MEDDLKKVRNERQPKKKRKTTWKQIKNKRWTKQKIEDDLKKKMEDNLKKNILKKWRRHKTKSVLDSS
jgi:hypothetical protein